MNHEPKKECFKTSVGGQALMEGIMMRGPEHICCAVRKPDGTIETKIEDTPKHGIWAKIPLVRGAISMIESLIIGYRYMMYSAQVSMGDEYDAEEEDLPLKNGWATIWARRPRTFCWRCGPRGRPVCHPAIHRSADGAGGRPRQGGHPGPLAESHPRSGAQSGHLSQLHGGHLQDEGDPPRVSSITAPSTRPSPAMRRRPAHRGECPQVYPFPPPLRHQFPDPGGHRQRVSSTVCCPGPAPACACCSSCCSCRWSWASAMSCSSGAAARTTSPPASSVSRSLGAAPDCV